MAEVALLWAFQKRGSGFRRLKTRKAQYFSPYGEFGPGGGVGRDAKLRDEVVERSLRVRQPLRKQYV